MVAFEMTGKEMASEKHWEGRRIQTSVARQNSTLRTSALPICLLSPSSSPPFGARFYTFSPLSQ